MGNVAGCNMGGDPTGNLLNVDPMLNTLADNGGSTRTCGLRGASMAVNTGNPAGCGDHLGNIFQVDQRGQTRTALGRCDIGAFELIP